MGLIRSGVLTVLAILIFLMLLVTGSLLSMTMSLNYQALEPELVSVATEIAVEQGINNNISGSILVMQEQCINNTNYVSSQEGYSFDIPCSVVLEGEEAILEFVIADMVNDAYYRDYGCDFWSCSVLEGDMPTHFFSQMAYDYWKSKFYFALMITLVLVVLGFLIAEGRKNYPFLLGGLIILAALPFVKVSWFFSKFGSFEVARMLGVFFSKSFNVFLIMVIIGAVLILLGIAIKFIGLGEWIYKVTGGEKRAMKAEVREEVKKEMKSKTKKK